MVSASEVQAAWEACDKTDTVFILVCTVFCWTIIPAVGLGYSGYSTRKSGLASAMPAVYAVAVCTIQWFLIGYTLAYGDGPGGVFGNLDHAFHRGVLAEPVGTIPAVLFSEFQLVFLATVCAISVGGGCERGRILPLIPFIFVRFLPHGVLTESADGWTVALGDLYLLPVSTHGVGRGFPCRIGSARLCWWHPRTHLQWCNCFGAEFVLVLSNRQIAEVGSSNAIAFETASAS